MIILIYLLGVILAYFTSKYFMIQFNKTLTSSYSDGYYFNNSDMLACMFISMGSYLVIFIFLITALSDYIVKNNKDWFKAKSKL